MKKYIQIEIIKTQNIYHVLVGYVVKLVDVMLTQTSFLRGLLDEYIQTYYYQSIQPKKKKDEIKFKNIFIIN